MKNEETILKACKDAGKDMEKFGIEHGFPVIFVVERMKNELDEISENKFKFTFFKKDQMHEAAQFAKKYDGELGAFDPNRDADMMESRGFGKDAAKIIQALSGSLPEV